MNTIVGAEAGVTNPRGARLNTIVGAKAGVTNPRGAQLNEIVQYEQTQVQASLYSDINIYNQYLEMAKSLSKTELVPASYRNKPENCLLAIDLARQIGCKSPFYVMQNLDIIQGKPSWSGKFCIALVKTYFTNDHLEWKGKEDEEGYGCRVIAQDSNGNECVGVWVTMKMARNEGWIDKNGSKWKTMPFLMLQYRAYSFFARVHCPEKLLGMGDEFDVQKISRTSQTIELEKKLLCKEE